MQGSVTFRRYDSRDAEAVWELHEWAMRDAGTDPADIPGTDDLRAVESAYLDTGGEFLVGVTDSISGVQLPETFDGALAAMGGFLPGEHGHEDERTVPGAVELHRMRVAPPLQGNGYGRLLLDELERRVDPSRFDCIVATTSRRQERAVDFYPEAGYREVSRSSMNEYELIHFEKIIRD